MEHKKARNRDPEATRCAALDAAQHLFAEKGFAGTSMREIASRSGVSQPLIYYHFGSKEGLYSAVKERLMKEGLRSLLPAAGDSSNAGAAPSGMIRAAYDFVSGNEDLMRLTAWAHLERERTPWPGEEEFTCMTAGSIRRHLSEIPAGRNLDPLIVTVMIAALVLYWSQHRHYYAGLFDEPLDRVTDRYLEQIRNLFFGEPIARKDQE